MQLIAEMVAEGQRGSVVTLICDSGDRYAGNYYNDEWLAAHGLDPEPHEAVLREFFRKRRLAGLQPPGRAG